VKQGAKAAARVAAALAGAEEQAVAEEDAALQQSAQKILEQQESCCSQIVVLSQTCRSLSKAQARCRQEEQDCPQVAGIKRAIAGITTPGCEV
jgi:hypothetical protein